PNMESMDINYNCGRLLAVADAIESWALSADNEKRATTAIRYFTRFSQYPCETWGIITNRLNIYKQKLGGRAKKYTDMIAEISARIDSNEFAKLKNLDGRMALGFDSQRQYILSTIKKSKENEED
ncbi:MAG: type I-C CRISPR-associated protein Cas8c/Csd1, partial [Oscillospiraceae bacterium]